MSAATNKKEDLRDLERFERFLAAGDSIDKHHRRLFQFAVKWTASLVHEPAAPMPQATINLFFTIDYPMIYLTAISTEKPEKYSIRIGVREE